MAATAGPSSAGAVDSRWWLFVAVGVAVGLLSGLAVTAAGVLFAVIAVGAEFVATPPVSLALPIAGAALVVFAIVLVNVAVALALPVGLFLDASAVADADLDWTPDPGLYAVAALAGTLIQPPLGALVGLYYLYRRWEHVPRGDGSTA